MYTLTTSPGIALDLAHAIHDEHRRRASSTRRKPRQPTAHSGKPHWWPARPWTYRPPAVA